MTEARRGITYSALLRERNYRLLWSGQTTSQLGDSFYDVGLVWLALGLSGNAPLALGAVMFARAVPYLFLGLAAGAYADRWNRRRLMIAADLIRGVLVVAIPLAHLLGVLALWELLAAAFLLTSARTFFQPALLASVPAVVPRDGLQPANGLLQASIQTAAVVGPMIAGAITATTSAYLLFVIDAGTFGVSVLTLLAVRLPRAEGGRAVRSTIVDELQAAGRAVRGDPLVLWSIITFGLGLVAMAGLVRVGLPLLTTRLLHRGPGTYGLLLGAMGVGTVIGAAVFGRWRGGGYRRAFFGAWAAWGTLFATLAAVRGVAAALLVMLAAGCVEAVTDVAIVARLQTSVADALLGKVFSAWATMANIADAVSGLIIGALLGVFSVPAVLVGAGVWTVAASGAGAMMSGARAQPAGPPPAGDADPPTHVDPDEAAIGSAR